LAGPFYFLLRPPFEKWDSGGFAPIELQKFQNPPASFVSHLPTSLPTYRQAGFQKGGLAPMNFLMGKGK